LSLKTIHHQQIKLAQIRETLCNNLTAKKSELKEEETKFVKIDSIKIAHE